MSKTKDALARLRAAGLSQTEIARRTGVSQSRLSRWEAGDVPAAADDALRLLELADGLPVKVDAEVAGQGVSHA